MHYKDFITKYQGKKVDYDGYYGAQCVDPFRFYCRDVLGIAQPKGVTGAKDFWTNYPTDPNLYNNFDRIANTPDFVPQPGDVWIWTAKYGKYGHVAIESYGEASTSTFECLSQNDPIGSQCALKTYKYTNVYGVLRPKNQRNIRINSDNSYSSSDSSQVLENDGSEMLSFLGCNTLKEAKKKLIEHLGEYDGHCDWGTDRGDGTGGHLGSERRKVKTLEATITRLENKMAGMTVYNTKSEWDRLDAWLEQIRNTTRTQTAIIAQSLEAMKNAIGE